MHSLNLLRRIWNALSAVRRRQVLLLAVFMILVSLMEVGVAGIISLLGVALTSPESVQNIAVIRNIYEMGFMADSNLPPTVSMLILLLSLVALATVVKNMLSALLTYRQNVVSQSIGWDLAGKVFRNYLMAPFVWHSQRNSANLHTHIVWRVNIGIYCMCVLTILSQSAVTVFLVSGAFILAPFEFLVFFGLAGSIACVVYKITKNWARDCGEQIKNINLGANKLSLAALQGMRELQIYNQHAAFESKFMAYAQPAIVTSTRLGVYPNIPSWVLESAGMCLLLGVVVMMGLFDADLVHISGTLALMAAVSWRLLPAMNRVVSNILQLKLYFAQVEAIVNDLTIPGTHVASVCRTFQHSIELRNIAFSYPRAEQPSLKELTLSIPHGQMVGFVGISGAGKSTLIGVLTGLLSPSSGDVLVDGQTVAPAPGYLKVGYVPQSPYLMDASLAENVAFSDFGDVPDEERVRHCCRMAAMDFLDELPQGLHTVLGERGVRLSGGQIQRVAIARALYSEPDILIFDEATSALDGAAEAAIQKTILSLHKDITIVVIAHRLSTVEGCDALYWLKDGTIFRSGTVEAVLPEYTEFLRSHAPDLEITAQGMP